VGGLAVDWFTGNVYVTETEDQLIAVARYDIHDDNMYRVIISSALERPTTIAIDPYLGSVYYFIHHRLRLLAPSNLPKCCCIFLDAFDNIFSPSDSNQSINVRFVGRRYTTRPGGPTVSGKHDQKVHS